MKNLLDTLSESLNLARQIEYQITNGLGYDTKTNFYSEFHSFAEIKNSQKGLQAHLSHLEMNSSIPIIRGCYWLLENAPEDYEFFICKRRLFGILGEILIKKQLSQKERTKQMKALDFLSKSYESTFKFYKEEAEYPSFTEKVFNYFSRNVNLFELINLIERTSEQRINKGGIDFTEE